MASLLKQSISSVITNLNHVDKKITTLQQESGQHEVFSDLLVETHRMRTSLTLLETTLGKPQPQFEKSFLLTVRLPHITLFQYLTNCMIASITLLRQLEFQLKKAKHGGHGGGGFFTKKTKSREPSPDIDGDLAIFCEQLRFHDIAITTGTQMIDCELSLEGNKKDMHLRAVNHTHQVLIETLGTLQSTAKAIQPEHIPASGKQDSGKRSGSTTPTGELNKLEPAALCDTATQLALFVMRETDREFIHKHSGFVPMSPLVEVMTRNSLTQTNTITSVLELSK